MPELDHEACETTADGEDDGHHDGGGDAGLLGVVLLQSCGKNGEEGYGAVSS